MSNSYYVVRYTGPFGFIKPWSAVRDEKTFSQQFLTPSIVEGLRQKLEVAGILRHRLSYHRIDMQQERTQSRAFEEKGGKDARVYSRNLSILQRGIMIHPTLHLAFGSREDALRANEQHICLCRNEDVLLPTGEMSETTSEEFDRIPGFELLFGRDDPATFFVGYNRFDNSQPMYGRLVIIGDPTGVPPAEI